MSPEFTNPLISKVNPSLCIATITDKTTNHQKVPRIYRHPHLYKPNVHREIIFPIYFIGTIVDRRERRDNKEEKVERNQREKTSLIVIILV